MKKPLDANSHHYKEQAYLQKNATRLTKLHGTIVHLFATFLHGHPDELAYDIYSTINQ
jgi:hypothetical protein